MSGSSLFGAFTTLPDVYDSIQDAALDAASLPGREDYGLVGIGLAGTQRPSGLPVEPATEWDFAETQVSVIVTVREYILGWEFEIPYVLVFEKVEVTTEEEPIEGHEDDNIVG